MNNATAPSSIRLHFIPEWMEACGLSRKSIMDHTGADKSLISRWFRGSLPSDQYLVRLADLFGIEREDLFRRPTEAAENSARHVTAASERASDPAPGRGWKQIPVYAAVQGKAGQSLITFDPVDHHAAPPDLANVRGAYGVLIKGDTMIPAFRPGDIIWVNPHKLPDRDSDVILYNTPPESEAEAIIKTLVNWSPEGWRLRQYQPPREWDESREHWPVCHRIVGKKSVR